MKEVQKVFADFEVRLKHLEYHLYQHEQNKHANATKNSKKRMDFLYNSNLDSGTYVNYGNLHFDQQDDSSDEEEVENDKLKSVTSPTSNHLKTRVGQENFLEKTPKSVTQQTDESDLAFSAPETPQMESKSSEGRRNSTASTVDKGDLLFVNGNGNQSSGTNPTNPPDPISSGTAEKKAAYYVDQSEEEQRSKEKFELQKQMQDCQWNSKFQKVMDEMKLITSNTPLETKIKVYTELSNLAEDFNFTANTYAKIIISEVGFPISKKTIKPVEIGGHAGGEKV